MPPVLPGAGAKQCRCIAPVLLQGLEGREQQQHAQGNLEVGVDEDQAALGVEVEAFHQPQLLECQGQAAVDAQQDDEGEGQRYSGEVAGHVGEGHHEATQSRVHPGQRIGAEQRDEQAADAGPERDFQGEADGLQVEGRAENLAVVAQAPAAFAGVEAVEGNPGQGRQLEGAEHQQERQDQQQGEPGPLHASSSRHNGLS